MDDRGVVQNSVEALESVTTIYFKEQFMASNPFDQKQVLEGFVNEINKEN